VTAAARASAERVAAQIAISSSSEGAPNTAMPLARSPSSVSQLDPTRACVKKLRGDHQRSALSGTSGRGPRPW
jgi:hypothetical protein